MKNIFLLLFLFVIIEFVNAETDMSFLEPETNLNSWEPSEHARLSVIYTDGDNGDGVGDGAIHLKSDLTNSPRGASYDFSEPMKSGKTVDIHTTVYNPNRSYVSFYVELYNKTENKPIGTPVPMGIPGNDNIPRKIKLNYTPTGDDHGDTLQIKFNLKKNYFKARALVIDNVFISPVIPVTPDLPLITPSFDIEDEMESMFQKYSDGYLGKTPLPREKLNRAINAYKQLNIKVVNNEIFGKSLKNFREVSFLRTFANYLKFNPSDNSVRKMANNTIWLMCKQIPDSRVVPSMLYSYREFGKSAVLMRDHLNEQTKRMFVYSLNKISSKFNHYWSRSYNESINENSINTDVVYIFPEIFMCYATWQKTPEERYRHMLGLQRFIERFLSHTYSTSDGIKVDGTGFHHWAAYEAYMYAFNTVGNMLNHFSTKASTFQVSEKNYKIFRKAILTRFVLANDQRYKSLSMVGRHPYSRRLTLSKDSIKKICIAGGKILKLNTADPAIAGIYNRIWGLEDEFNFNEVTSLKNNEGFYQLNYDHAGIYRMSLT